MTSCTIAGCKINIWNISSNAQKDLNPISICHKHLKDEKNYSELYKALVLARFDRQKDFSVTDDKWTFTKILATWSWSSFDTCQTCQRTDQLWASVYMDGDEFESWLVVKYSCDTHLRREKRFLKISHGTPDLGIHTIESTWNQTKDTADPKLQEVPKAVSNASKSNNTAPSTQTPPVDSRKKNKYVRDKELEESLFK